MTKMTTKTRRPAQGDSLRTFGDARHTRMYSVGESALTPGEVHITQYGGLSVGPLTPAQARTLAAALVAAADALDATNGLVMTNPMETADDRAYTAVLRARYRGRDLAELHMRAYGRLRRARTPGAKQALALLARHAFHLAAIPRT